MWRSGLMGQAIKDAFLKLDPRIQSRNIVMLIVELGAVLTTVIAIIDLFTGGDFKFNGQISLWLWFTVLFANFAEALAEGRGRAQAESLRQARNEATGNRLRPDGGLIEIPNGRLNEEDLHGFYKGAMKLY